MYEKSRAFVVAQKQYPRGAIVPVWRSREGFEMERAMALRAEDWVEVRSKEEIL